MSNSRCRIQRSRTLSGDYEIKILNFNKNLLLRKEVFGAKQAIRNIIGFVIVVEKLVSFMIRSVNILKSQYIILITRIFFKAWPVWAWAKSKPSRHGVDKCPSRREVNILVNFFLQAIKNSLILSLIRFSNPSSDRGKSRNLSKIVKYFRFGK